MENATGGVGGVVIRGLSYIWRLFWTLVAVTVLTVGGFLFALTLIPLATLSIRDEQERNRRALFIIRESFRVYIAMLRVMGILKLAVVGAAKLTNCKGKLIIANHPTLLDIVLLASIVPDTKCVVKSELFSSRLMSPIVRAAGYIRNDCDPGLFIEKCRDTLNAGFNLVIFPEGTRSVPGKPLHFQRGFAHIATLTGANLQPVLITCRPITLVKGEPYYRIPETRPVFRIEVGDEVDPHRFLNAGSQSRARSARALVSFMEADFGSRLQQCVTSNPN